ncbi:MAG TPA: hypothetical protein VN682_21840 [Terriglobales bacterium]|nr:hypothetical protein [Terriglobales bacterium]
MTLKSALEDLSRSTLRAISGYLQKLEYLAGLRDRGGYSHWGFGKMHGESAANRALREAHKSAVSQVLSTPLSTLLADVEDSTIAEGQDTKEYLKTLSEKGNVLLPNDPGPGAARHLSSVLHALLGLEKHRDKNATRQVS